MRFEKLQGLDAIKQQQFEALKNSHLTVSEGSDPTTGKRMYVDCVVGTETYRMDAGNLAAEKHNGGIRLAEMSEEETTFVVDFNNEVHYAVPIAAAKAIALQQAQDARNHYIEYQMFKQQIDGAATVAELRALSQVFTVNTL